MQKPEQFAEAHRIVRPRKLGRQLCPVCCAAPAAGSCAAGEASGASGCAPRPRPAARAAPAMPAVASLRPDSSASSKDWLKPVAMMVTVQKRGWQ
jgi:hypothetical protein